MDELMNGQDSNLGVEDVLLQFALANEFTCTTGIEAIRYCSFYEIAELTFFENINNPELTPYTEQVILWAK